MFDLTKKEAAFLKRLNTPNKIQDYLDSIPFNFEETGETCMSPRKVILAKKAHCIEGALLACAALWYNGKNPLIINLKVAKGDFDHALALYKENGYWGAISKTNHNVLRFRDPVYKTVRELVMSYFHEYFLISSGKKTLLGFSKPISMKQFGKDWITKEEDLWDIAEYMYDAPLSPIAPIETMKHLRKAHTLERTSASTPEWQQKG